MILAIDSSASLASAALADDGRLIACYFQNTGLTHSTVLMPLIDSMLKNCGADKKDITLIAITQGPGSFTGLRIGMATAKGLALGLGIKCAGVSTLLAMAVQLNDREGTAVCAMDARRGQVYNANFQLGGKQPLRLCEDKAVAASDLVEEINGLSGRVYLFGDGAHIVACEMDKAGLAYTVPFTRFQSAAGVALAPGLVPLPPEDVNPVYLRLSQAERELLQGNKG